MGLLAIKIFNLLGPNSDIFYLGLQYDLYSDSQSANSLSVEGKCKGFFSITPPLQHTLRSGVGIVRIGNTLAGSALYGDGF